MKTNYKPLYYVAIGFLLMGFFQSLTFCNRDNDFLRNSISKDELNVDLDYQGVKDASKIIENALLEADSSVINELIIDDLQLFYNEVERSYSSDELQAIGNAFKKAKLTAITGNFAEYTYVIDKVDYTLTMALNDDGEWKIVKF